MASATDPTPGKALFAAVLFARRMLRDGTPPGAATAVAADYYGVAVSQVAHYTGQAAGTYTGRRRARG